MPKTSPHSSNQKIVETLNLIADLLEIKGEIIYKILAYRKAADNINALGRSVKDIREEGDLKEIPGVGEAIAEKIDELLRTGELAFLEELTKEVPITLADILEVTGVGPKRAALFWRELGITTLAELEEAAEQGALRNLEGMGETSEAKVLEGIRALARRTKRTPLGVAWPFAQELLTFLRDLPGVTAAEAGGSLRRMRATVGDLDLVAAAENSEPVMEAFVSRPDVMEILGHGSTKSSVEFSNGLRAQLWVHPPERFGTALQYATGSKDHSVRLREFALSQGYSLSEHALTEVETEGEVLCAREEEVYETLGLPWIPPELREDHGEIQAAQNHDLPGLIARQHLISELHTHSTWSDGRYTIAEMVHAALDRGYQVMAVTDHSGSLGIAGGLSVDELWNQREEIERVREQFGEAITILHGTEVEIKADGSLDFPDEVLADLDIVVASLHTSLRQPREKITNRLLNAIRNPHVDIIGHPTGRLFPDREGADLDMDRVLEAAAESGVALEINAHPSRLDLEDIYARRAIELGILLSINTDAHAPEHMELVFYGLGNARRGWVGPEHVINTWSPETLLSWLKDR
jgi:DNA polymerase (family 10)